VINRIQVPYTREVDEPIKRKVGWCYQIPAKGTPCI